MREYKLGNLIELVPDLHWDDIDPENGESIWMEGYTVKLFGKFWAHFFNDDPPGMDVDIVSTRCIFCDLTARPSASTIITNFFDDIVTNCQGDEIDPTIQCICKRCQEYIHTGDLNETRKPQIREAH